MTTDLLAALQAALDRARQIDQLPCPECGGDRLRQDFTDTDRCHVLATEVVNKGETG